MVGGVVGSTTASCCGVQGMLRELQMGGSEWRLGGVEAVDELMSSERVVVVIDRDCLAGARVKGCEVRLEWRWCRFPHAKRLWTPDAEWWNRGTQAAAAVISSLWRETTGENQDAGGERGITQFSEVLVWRMRVDYTG